MTDWLEEIGQSYSTEMMAKELLLRAVRGARSEGVCWQDIADAMGISRQGASQRFKDLVDA
jgi:predicted transcriptional regulator